LKAAAEPAPPAVAGDWLDARMSADLLRLRALPPVHYAIQLLTADPRERAAIETFLRIASRELNPDRFMVYPAGTAERPLLSVLYGSYTERADANAEIARLPQRLKKFNPYARSLQAIRDDVRSGY
jgi:septal ring-binding cell division protein DamX